MGQTTRKQRRRMWVGFCLRLCARPRFATYHFLDLNDLRATPFLLLSLSPPFLSATTTPPIPDDDRTAGSTLSARKVWTHNLIHVCLARPSCSPLVRTPLASAFRFVVQARLLTVLISSCPPPKARPPPSHTPFVSRFVKYLCFVPIFFLVSLQAIPPAMGGQHISA